MTRKPIGSERFSLARWSRRKLAAATKESQSVTPASTVAAPAQPTPPAPAAAELPSVESLSFESDFTPFFRPGVDLSLQRAALKQLLRDPRFNVMDGLDVYIDDYSKPDPIPPDMLTELMERFDFKDPVAAPATTEERAVAPVPDSAPQEPPLHNDKPAQAIASAEPEREGGGTEALSSIAATENAATRLNPGQGESSRTSDERR